MRWKLARKKIEETVIDPFRPENIIQALKNPDEVLLKSLRSLTEMTGSITGISFKSYSKLKSEAKGKSEFTFIGEKKVEEVKLQLFQYNEKEFTETKEITDYELVDSQNQSSNYWLNLHGIHDVKLIESIAQKLNLENLTVRQVIDTTQRPKM